MSFADLLEHAIETTQPATKRGSSAASVASSRFTANLEEKEQLDRLKRKHDDLRRQFQRKEEDLIQTTWERNNLAANLAREKAQCKEARLAAAKYRSSSEANLATAQKLAHEKQVMETQYHHDKRFAVQCLRAQNGVLDSLQDEAIAIRAKLRPQSAAAAPAANRGTAQPSTGARPRPQTAGAKPVQTPGRLSTGAAKPAAFFEEAAQEDDDTPAEIPRELLDAGHARLEDCTRAFLNASYNVPYRKKAELELEDKQKELQEALNQKGDLEVRNRKMRLHVKRSDTKRDKALSEARWLRDNEERCARTIESSAEVVKNAAVTSAKKDRALAEAQKELHTFKEASLARQQREQRTLINTQQEARQLKKDLTASQDLQVRMESEAQITHDWRQKTVETFRYKYSWQNDEIMKLRQKLANAGVSTENIASRSLSTGSIQRPPSPRRSPSRGLSGGVGPQPHVPLSSPHFVSVQV